MRITLHFPNEKRKTVLDITLCTNVELITLRIIRERYPTVKNLQRFGPLYWLLCSNFIEKRSNYMNLIS